MNLNNAHKYRDLHMKSQDAKKPMHIKCNVVAIDKNPEAGLNKTSTCVPRQRRRYKPDYEVQLPWFRHNFSRNLPRTWLRPSVVEVLQTQADFRGARIDSSEVESTSHDPASAKELLPESRAVRLVASGSDSDRPARNQVNDGPKCLWEDCDAYHATSPQTVSRWRRWRDRDLFILFNHIPFVKAELFVPGKNYSDRLARSRDCTRSALVHQLTT